MVIDAIKRTPLKSVVDGVKQVPPMYQIRHYLIDKHEDKLFFEWYPDIYNRHSSDPIDE